MPKPRWGENDVWAKRDWSYVPRAATDISKTFARVKKQLEEEKARMQATSKKVLLMKKQAKA
jgi:hypothetical protein